MVKTVFLNRLIKYNSSNEFKDMEEKFFEKYHIIEKKE